MPSLESLANSLPTGCCRMEATSIATPTWKGIYKTTLNMKLIATLVALAWVSPVLCWSVSNGVGFPTVSTLSLASAGTRRRLFDDSLHKLSDAQVPSMFLSGATLSASPPLPSATISLGKNFDVTVSQRDPKIIGKRKPREPRVLGFDIFTLDAHKSSVDVGKWKRGDLTQNSHGLTWNSNTLAPITTVNPLTGLPNLHGKGNAKSFHFGLDSTLPAWFPWIPTKSQIQSLKVSELREACFQRGLAKDGSKAKLQDRLWTWTTERQEQHQQKISEDFLWDWFQDVDRVPDAKSQHNSSSLSAKEEFKSPDSLADWARTVNIQPLLQKREAIHRRKRQGLPSPKARAAQNRADSQKEYLSKLSKALKEPSSPYASNIKVKEIYTASKQADQLGQREVAINLLNTLLQLTPNDARAYRRLSRMYSEQNDLDRARATLQSGIRRLPANPWLWHGLGQLELKYGGSISRARRHFQKAIDIDPTFAHSFHALGTLEHNQGNIAKAMKTLKKGIENCPTNHRLHHALGDLYRGAKLLRDAQRSYERALEYGPPVSRCFAYSALAANAYEEGNVAEARRWLHLSLKVNNGRHAQGWVSLAQLEEAEDNNQKARYICMNAITIYERGLLEMRERYKKQSFQGKEQKANTKTKRNSSKNPVDLKAALLQEVPRYRSGDKFIRVYRNWARLEEKYGSFETVDLVYDRASQAFPHDDSLVLEWARYHSKMLNHDRARVLYMEACNRVGNRHADPYRKYAQMEMSLGNYGEAKKILFKGAQSVSKSSDGGLGNKRGLAELFHTWAICEWNLNNLPRAELLLDHALRLTDVGDEGTELRSFILYSIARLEHFRGEFHLAQHCIGLCLKENSMPGGNAKVWELWEQVARRMGNNYLERECRAQAEGDEFANTNGSRFSGSLHENSRMKGVELQHLIRQEPWQSKIFGDKSTAASSSDFFKAVRYPNTKGSSVNHAVELDDY